MSLEDSLNELWDSPDVRAKVLTLFWVTSLCMVVLGYLLMIYLFLKGDL
jgi:hypothetical protein